MIKQKLREYQTSPTTLLLLIYLALHQSATPLPEKPLQVSQIYSKASKVVSLRLELNKTLDQSPLGTSWFVEYTKGQYNLHGQAEASNLRLAAVYTKQVFFHAFEEPWIEVDPLQKKNMAMKPVLTISGDSNITAFQMEANSPLLTLAFSNGSVSIQDLSRIGEKEALNLKIDLDPKTDSKGSGGLDNDRIRAIGVIPYTDQLIVYPSHLKFFKFSRIDGKIISTGKPPLDAVRLIITPQATTWPLRDPFNPSLAKNDYFMDPQISKRVYSKITQTQAFLATSHTSESFAVIDWTTMKAYNHLSLRNFFPGQKMRNEDYVVQSACFYGGAPEAHAFLLVPSFPTTQLVIFSGIFRNFIGRVVTLPEAQKTDIRWAYGTEYVVVLQKGLKIGSDAYKTTILNLGTFGQNQYIRKLVRPQERIYERQMPFFDVMAFKLTPIPEFDNLRFEDSFVNMDHVYLINSLSEGVLTVQPPIFNWEFCTDNNVIFRPLGADRMLYGGYRVCERCFTSFRLLNDVEISQKIGNEKWAESGFLHKLREKNVQSRPRWHGGDPACH